MEDTFFSSRYSAPYPALRRRVAALALIRGYRIEKTPHDRENPRCYLDILETPAMLLAKRIIEKTPATIWHSEKTSGGFLYPISTDKHSCEEFRHRFAGRPMHYNYSIFEDVDKINKIIVHNSIMDVDNCAYF